MKKLSISLFLLILLVALGAAASAPPRYAVALGPTPVLNTPDFPTVFSGKLRLDPCRGVRPIEFVALTGTLFRIEGEQKRDGVLVYRVTSNDYPYPSKTGYFVDARFVKTVASPGPERPRRLPGLGEIQQRLAAALGKPYVWGGNVKDGVPLVSKLYPGADTLAGVDCSGLLYQATDGYTPRNTSTLTSFGKGVPVAGLTPSEMDRKLRPLDLIVWKGHVMIVLDSDSIIESTMGCSGGVAGVHIVPRKEALARLMRVRRPLDEYTERWGKGFVVRRWFSATAPSSQAPA